MLENRCTFVRYSLSWQRFVKNTENCGESSRFLLVMSLPTASNGQFGVTDNESDHIVVESVLGKTASYTLDKTFGPSSLRFYKYAVV